VATSYCDRLKLGVLYFVPERLCLSLGIQISICCYSSVFADLLSMAVPAFGWSSGDIVLAIKLVHTASKAFKDSGGAAEGYEESIGFLKSFGTTVECLEEHVTKVPHGDYSNNIAAQLDTVKKPWNAFKDYLKKYEKSLSPDSMRTNISKAPRKVQWAIKELNGEVSKLKTAVSHPLNAINTLIALSILFDL
jgi:hypothetical protein